MPTPYPHTLRWRTAVEPAALAAALARTADGPYLTYEDDGRVAVAEGEHAAVTLTAAGLAVDGGPPGPVTGSPLAAAGRAVAAHCAGRRAYGWVSFEAAHLLLGGRPDPDAVLLHVAVPRREVICTPGAVTLHAENPAALEHLRGRVAAAVADTPDVAPALPDAWSRADDPAYRAAVAAAVRRIRDGGYDKVILSRLVEVGVPVDLPATYLAGRRANTPARSYLLRWGGWEAAGFSPEVVVQVGADGAVRTQPLAGTRALSGAGDAGRRAELYRDAKEVFEHAISVRLAVAEMERVCAPGSVAVRQFMGVAERGSVQHLASEVTGQRAAGRTSWDVLAALFPAVTASGIPKAAACAAIRAGEAEHRGLYSGAVLAVDPDGALDAALVLRSVFRRAGRTWLRAGAGVVADSTADRELEETREKLRSVSRYLVGQRSPGDARPAAAVAGVAP